MRFTFQILNWAFSIGSFDVFPSQGVHPIVEFVYYSPGEFSNSHALVLRVLRQGFDLEFRKEIFH